MNTCGKVVVLLVMVLAVMALAAAPGRGDPPATTQPARADSGEQARPAVVGAGPASEPAPPRDNEVSLAPATQPDKSHQARTTPPPVPSEEDIMSGLLPGEEAVDGPAGPGTPGSAAKVTDSLPVRSGTVALMPGQPTKDSQVIPVDSIRADSRKLFPDGHVIADRVGHLARERGRWTFVFEADKSGAAEAPLPLLPNSQLEIMLNHTSNGQNQARFSITGVVTQFRQSNYLLVRKVLIEHNLDRF